MSDKPYRGCVDILERLKESPLPSLTRICQDRRDSATALEAKDKEIEALREELKSTQNKMCDFLEECAVQHERAIKAEARAATAERYERLYNDEVVERLKAERERDEARAALKREQDNVYSSFDKWSKTLGWGLSGHQPECWALMDSAVDELVVIRTELDHAHEAMSPSKETKFAYIGEFKFDIDCWDEDGEECSRKVTVPWTTIKEIMAAIRERAARAVIEK